MDAGRLSFKAEIVRSKVSLFYPLQWRLLKKPKPERWGYKRRECRSQSIEALFRRLAAFTT